MTNLKRPTRELEIDGVRFVLRRPGRGGVARVARRMTTLARDPLGGVDAALLSMDGEGLFMEAVLHEYLVEGPSEWAAEQAPNQPKPKRPMWDFDDADPELFARVGKEAVAFHDTFRGTDAVFAGEDGEAVRGTPDVEDPTGLSASA